MSQFKTKWLPNGNIKVTIPIVFRKTALGRRLEPAGGEEDISENRQAMLLAFARGRRWQKLIDDGVVSGAGEIALNVSSARIYSTKGSAPWNRQTPCGVPSGAVS